MQKNKQSKNNAKILPIFAKKGNSSSSDRDSSARSVDVPHCESYLSTLGEVWVLDRKPQPLVPAGTDSRRTEYKEIKTFSVNSNPRSVQEFIEAFLHSLPSCAESFVWSANRQSERFPFSKHLTGNVEVWAVLLVEAREPQHWILQQSFVALLLPLSLQTASVTGEETE